MWLFLRIYKFSINNWIFRIGGLFEQSDVALQVFLIFEFSYGYVPVKLQMERDEPFKIKVR